MIYLKFLVFIYYYLEFYVSDLVHSTLQEHGDQVFGYQMLMELLVKYNQSLLHGDQKDSTHLTLLELLPTTSLLEFLDLLLEFST